MRQENELKRAIVKLFLLPFVAATAGAATIDFRDVSFDTHCSGLASCTFETLSLTSTGGVFSWESADGFGVDTGEFDEIDYPQTVTVEWTENVQLDFIFFSDLYAIDDGGADKVEEALITLFDDNDDPFGGFPVTVFGMTSRHAGNGEVLHEFLPGVQNVRKVRFESVDENDDEYSVARIGFTPMADITDVPEPSTMALISVGLLGLYALRRKARNERRSRAGTGLTCR